MKPSNKFHTLDMELPSGNSKLEAFLNSLKGEVVGNFSITGEKAFDQNWRSLFGH